MVRLRTRRLMLVTALCLGLGPFGGAPGAGAQVMCTQSNNQAYSLAKATKHLVEAERALTTCAYIDGAPWQACLHAYAQLSDADVNLSQIFIDALPGGRCWTCNPSLLIQVAGRLSENNKAYVEQSKRQARFDNTVFNIETQKDKPYCSASSPAVPPHQQNYSGIWIGQSTGNRYRWDLRSNGELVATLTHIPASSSSKGLGFVQGEEAYRLVPLGGNSYTAYLKWKNPDRWVQQGTATVNLSQGIIHVLQGEMTRR